MTGWEASVSWTQSFPRHGSSRTTTQPCTPSRAGGITWRTASRCSPTSPTRVTRLFSGYLTVTAERQVGRGKALRPVNSGLLLLLLFLLQQFLASPALAAKCTSICFASAKKREKKSHQKAVCFGSAHCETLVRSVGQHKVHLTVQTYSSLNYGPGILHSIMSPHFQMQQPGFPRCPLPSHTHTALYCFVCPCVSQGLRGVCVCFVCLSSPLCIVIVNGVS